MKYSENQFLREHQIIKQFHRLILKIDNPAKFYPKDAKCAKCLLRAKRSAERNLKRLAMKYPDAYQKSQQPQLAIPTLTEVLSGGAA